MDIEKIKDAEQKIKEIYGDVKVEFESICGMQYYSCHMDTDFGKFKFYITQGKWNKPYDVKLDCESDDYLNNLKALKKLRRNKGYKTDHDYDKESEVIKGYEAVGLLKIHK